MQTRTDRRPAGSAVEALDDVFLQTAIMKTLICIILCVVRGVMAGAGSYLRDAVFLRSGLPRLFTPLDRRHPEAL